MKLTKLDIAALRKCSRIVFRHNDGVSSVTAVKENRPSEKDPFARDIDHGIGAAWQLEDYAEGQDQMTYEARRDGAFTAFEVVYRYNSRAPIDTIISMLRPDDVIRLDWKRGGRRCGLLVEAGLHGDALDLTILRGVLPNGGARQALYFHLTTQISEDTAARMIMAPYRSTRASVKTEEAHG